MRPTAVYFNIKENDLLFLFLSTVIFLLVTRVYNFFEYGDNALILLSICAITFAFFKMVLLAGPMIFAAYFFLLGIFLSLSSQQNIFFFKTQLVLAAILILTPFDGQQKMFVLRTIARTVLVLGFVLFLRPDFYSFYDFNIVGTDFFEFSGVKFPATFSLIRAASSFGSSNELGIYLGLYLIYSLGRQKIAVVEEILFVLLILLTQSRTALLLLMLYFVFSFTLFRCLFVLLSGLLGLSILIITKYIDTILEFSRLWGGSAGAQKSVQYRIDSILNSLNTGLFPWEAHPGSITPHSIWFYHLDQVGWMATIFLTISVCLILGSVAFSSGAKLFIALVLVSLTVPNMILSPAIMLVIVWGSYNWNQPQSQFLESTKAQAQP